MPERTDGNEEVTRRLDALLTDLAQQGRRVQSLVEAAYDAVFTDDRDAAARLAEVDDEIDRVDVQIERASVDLLAWAVRTHTDGLTPDQLRLVLMIAKINNEFERVADTGVRVAKAVGAGSTVSQRTPGTFRVLCNSVIGILRDSTRSVERLDEQTARTVLDSEDVVESFKAALVRDLQRDATSGALGAEQAITLSDIANQSVTMADHCTNIAQQVIYARTGRVYRHEEGRWEQLRIDAGE